MKLAFFQVDTAAQQELQRHRLRPQHATYFKPDTVVRVHRVTLQNHLDFERMRQDARLEIQDRLAQGLPMLARCRDEANWPDMVGSP